jgi:hypothetical protein
MTFQSISVCPGMAWQPGSAWAAPIKKDSADGEQDLSAVAQRPAGLGRLGRAQPRRRARDIEGQFRGDDPATAENEAFEPDTTADDEREN